MAGDGNYHDGLIVFMQSPYGRSKTVRSKRQNINILWYAGKLLETLRQKYFNIENIGILRKISSTRL